MTRCAIERIKNTFHPLTKNLKEGYYTPLNTSAIKDMLKIIISLILMKKAP